MGTLLSTTDHTGLEVNGVLLGWANEIEGDVVTYAWDDSMLPNGTLDAEGNITPDEEVA